MNTLTLPRTQQLSEIAEPLLRWYRSQGRDLPWREDPSPYHVWISEIMLQQTRVEAVKPYFARFCRALPDVAALAAIAPDDLLKLWEGLGYYSRARNLQKAARQIIAEHGGIIPADFDALLALPGIGRYTAGAVSSIAYAQHHPAVDGNVLRIVMRLLSSAEDITKEKVRQAVENELRKILPADAGSFNQAMMDLGATVCLPKGAAKCSVCPLRQLCLACAEQRTAELPHKAPAKARRIEQRTVLLIMDGSKAALQQRPKKGLLAGLWELPNIEGHLAESALSVILHGFGLELLELEPLPPARHIFSHIEWQMIGYRIAVRHLGVAEAAAPYGEPAGPPLHWAEKAELNDRYAVPTAFKFYTDIFCRR